MKERPILFSAPMVRAILAGQKTQTRRIVKPTSGPHSIRLVIATPDSLAAFVRHHCPYGQPGDRLWVKETWAAPLPCNNLKPTDIEDGTPLYFRADDPKNWERQPDRGIIGKWRPSIFMRRWMSRITLEITCVRVERLQDISEADALAEGMDVFEDGAGFTVRPGGTWQRNPEDAFRNLWEQINSPGSWAANPWVWVIKFRRVA